MKEWHNGGRYILIQLYAMSKLDQTCTWARVRPMWDGLGGHRVLVCQQPHVIIYVLLHHGRTWGITKDGQGYHHLPHVPQPWAFTHPYISGHLTRIHRNHPNPLGPWPYGSTGKGFGRTWKHDEPPSQHKSKSIHGHNMNDKASSQVWYDHDIGTIF
jgi:hypothetical protein